MHKNNKTIKNYLILVIFHIFPFKYARIGFGKKTKDKVGIDMLKEFILFLATLIYMEVVYHLACFGFTACNPLLMLPSVLFFAGLSALLIGFFRKKAGRVILWCFLSIDFLLFASQVVYMKIFKQPLLIAAIKNAGGMALKNYWREALQGILAASPFLLLLALPLFLTGFLLKKKYLRLGSHKLRERVMAASMPFAGLVLLAVVLFAGYKLEAEYFEDYKEFYDPQAAIEQFGVTASIQRDLAGDWVPKESLSVESWQEEIPDSAMPAGETEGSAVSGGSASEAEEEQEEPEEKGVDTSPNILDIDFEKLEQISDTDEVKKLNEYLKATKPTNKNEYTGIFEDYNLIYLTAEGFCPYAVDEELTPTLYKLIHSGFVAEDYYVPLWQTSTSDGEYVNLTGLIPDQQFSMKRSAVNEEPFSLPAYFARDGAKSYAYHNNTLSYYDRHLSHPNLGYDFKASKLGDLEEAEWGSSVFPMENAEAWPSSDLDMMKATIPEYINDERFHVYYMTVSGHMNYNFVGNQMSKKNKAAVEGLPYSEEGQAYIACNMELDKALEYLIDELDKAGKLANTVICMSADHYPYAMEMSSLEELAGKPLEGTLEIYKNNLILWNSEMETVKIEKSCSALDIIPTLLNLFGFEFDSRLFVGHDMLSDSLPMVVFADRSFITDKILYYRKDRSVQQRTDEVTDEEYLDAMRTQVKNMHKYSSGILIDDYYRYVAQCLPEDFWE